MKRNSIVGIGMVLMNVGAFLTPDAAQGNGGGVPTSALPTAGNGVEEDEEEKASTDVIKEIDGVKYIREEYKNSKKGGINPIAGFGFAVPRFDSAAQAIAHLTKLATKQNKKDKDGNVLNGETILLDLFHSALEGKARIRVKAGEPLFKDDNDAKNFYEEKAKKNPSKLLFTAEDAAQWLPGVRELSAKKAFEQGMDELNELIKAKGAAHPDVIKACMALAQKRAKMG